jgi:hypothetical protein
MDGKLERGRLNLAFSRPSKKKAGGSFDPPAGCFRLLWFTAYGGVVVLCPLVELPDEPGPVAPVALPLGLPP